MNKNNEDEFLTKEQEIKLAVLRERNMIFNRLNKQMDKILNTDIELEDFTETVFRIKEKVSNELDDYKTEVDLCDDNWEQDELFDIDVLQ